MLETQIKYDSIRNVAVIAHVDHGKTPLIDALLTQTHVFRTNQDEMKEERIMDSNELEKERGITIAAKNCAIEFNGTKINIIDTPGHADFSGEVERTLGMADGAVLIIDAQEGPMPQTRFVLKKAFELGLKVIVVINKIDKENARIPMVIEKTGDLFLDLATTDEQLEFPILYANGREGKVWTNLPDDITSESSTLPLLEKIIEFVPAPQNPADKPFKMVISSLGYDQHLGRIIIGKIHQGTIAKQQQVIIAQAPDKKFTIERVMVNQGLGRVEVPNAHAGDIISITGIPTATIGTTVTDPSEPSALPAIAISEPTLHMEMGPNTSPFSGNEGDFTTGRLIEERLFRELETNLSLRVEKKENGKLKVSGRGELHLAILLETLRREGFELEVGQPEVITKEIDGKLHEPVEEVSIVVPEAYVGAINQEMGKRFGEMIHMKTISPLETEFIFHIPTRTTLGLRNILATLTKGTIVYNSQMLEYRPKGKDLPKLRPGVLIADSPGKSLAYGLLTAQGRGITFIEAGTEVYAGMIIGQNATDKDIHINVCKGKKLTNMRSSASDGNIQLEPATIFSLEQSIDFLESDELLEITPKSLRLRKRELDAKR